MRSLDSIKSIKSKQMMFILIFIIFSGLFVFKQNKKENFTELGAKEYSSHIQNINNLNHNDTSLALGPRGNVINLDNNRLF